MNDRLEVAEQAVEGALATARELALYRAFARKHGVYGLPEVPTRKTRDVTEADKTVIIAARAKRGSDFLWLLLGRDPVCVELDLTGEQVAGVLAEATRKKNDAAAAPRPSARATAIADARAVLQPVDRASPANWPPRIAVLNGGKTDEPPARNHVERNADEADKHAVIAARIQIKDNVGWDMFRQVYGAHRRLTTQQIAGIVAVHNRSPRPEAQA